jgi:hypothetical protein
MRTSPDHPSSADIAMEVASLSAGLGTLTIPLFPLLLPGLVLVLRPLAVLALAEAILAAPVVLPFWLIRRALRAR